MTDEQRWFLNRLPRRIKRVVRRPFEWLGIFLAELVLSSLPHRALFAVCDVLSAVMYRFDARGRRQSLVNLRVVTGAFPPDDFSWRHVRGFGLPPPTRREEIILRRSYRNMARTIGHVFWTSRRARERTRAVGVLEPFCREWLAANKPAVTVSAHLGCWEILSQLVYEEGHPMTSVAKNIGSKAMTRLLMKSRKSIGQNIIPADGAFRPLLQALKDGSDIGLLVDQFVRREDGGLWVRFFGRPMCVSVAPAFLAAKARVPIIVAWSRPLKDGTYRCEHLGTFPVGKGVDIRTRTREILALLEKVIRRHPSAWILNYRYFNEGPTAEERRSLAE